MRTRMSRLTWAAAFAALLLPLVAAASPPEMAATSTPGRYVAPTAAASGPMRSTSRAGFQLKWQADNFANNISGLRTALGFPPAYRFTRLSRLLLDANRTATRCKRATNQSRNGALYDGVNPVNWFCLQDANPNSDARTTNWSPQGISGTSDAYPGGTVNGARAFAFTWHYQGNARSRVTFLNEEPQAGTSAQYRHVLFVRPVTKGGHADWENVASHAGGLVWYHHYLVTAKRTTGLQVFDMRNLWDMTRAGVHWDRNPQHFGRQSNGSYGTYGYRYVLPLIGAWQTNPPVSGGCTPQGGQGTKPCYDYAGLDRSTSPPTLLTGEFCRPGTTGCRGRVAVWRMETGSCTMGCLAHNNSNVARPTAAYTQPGSYIQGGVRWRGVYYFTASHNRNQLGTLYVDRPNVQPDQYRAGVGAQDLYWLRTNARQLWSLTEFPGRGKRTLYGIAPPPGP